MVHLCPGPFISRSRKNSELEKKTKISKTPLKMPQRIFYTVFLPNSTPQGFRTDFVEESGITS